MGLLGTGTDPYLTALLGTMEAGAVAVPLDMGMSLKALSAELSLPHRKQVLLPLLPILSSLSF